MTLVTTDRGAPPPEAEPITQSVVVENPADEHGNPSIAIGITIIKPEHVALESVDGRAWL